MQPGHAAA
jgi:hypothetical protein